MESILRYFIYNHSGINVITDYLNYISLIYFAFMSSLTITLNEIFKNNQEKDILSKNNHNKINMFQNNMHNDSSKSLNLDAHNLFTDNNRYSSYDPMDIYKQNDPATMNNNSENRAEITKQFSSIFEQNKDNEIKTKLHKIALAYCRLKK